MDNLLAGQTASTAGKLPKSLPRWKRSRAGLLVLGMLAAISSIALVSIWDVKRRHAESLEDFGHHQELLARGLASELEARLDAARQRTGAGREAVLAGLRKLEQPGNYVVLVWPPDERGFLTTTSQPVQVELLGEAARAGRGYLRLPRESAPPLGRPRRAAVAGLASLMDADGRTWRIAAVASARRARDREREAAWRIAIAVCVAAGAVLALGGLALHWQRQEMRTQQALAVEEARGRREAELERASRAATLGTLAMGITHELSTPLGIIAGRAEQLLSRLQGDERAARSAQVIQEQAGRMGQVIRGILGLVRDQAPIADRLSPESICAGATALVGHRFTETDTELRIDAVPDARLPVLAGDQRLLEHALVNLLLNACDACAPGGHVELRVRLREEQVLFSVIDDGAGISEEAAARAMEPFFTTKPAGKGTGLGLAVAQEIVKSHRGALRIGPRVEGGTCAEIALPRAA